MKYRGSAVIVLAILLLCMFSFFVPSLKMESSENRTLATFDMVLHPQADSVVYHTSPVERLDAALSDQFPFREAVVKKYLSFFNLSENLTHEMAQKFGTKRENQYVLHNIGNYATIEDTDYITYIPGTKSLHTDIVERRMEQLAYVHERFPDMKMYIYFATQAKDTPWFNDYIGATAIDHFQEIAAAAPDYIATNQLSYQDLNDYMQIHYKTDHHWNHRGARRGYEDIYAMLHKDFKLGKILVPTAENNVSETYDFRFLGSFGRSLGELYKGEHDEFSFYEYDFSPSRTAVLDPETLEEIEVASIGLYEEYQKGAISMKTGIDHYIRMYGSARGKDGTLYSDSEYLFVTKCNNRNGKNLLICGDSYARAVRDPLATHFDTTIYMDYRLFSKVPLDYIIERYGVDALVICSNSNMWNQEMYLFTLKEDA